MTILVPVDGSGCADGALRLALRLAAPDGEVVIAHAIDRSTMVAECVNPYGNDIAPALQALENSQREILARSAERARAAGIRYSTVPLDGPAVVSIVTVAREQKVDAIAMGTHGRRGLARALLGNTALGVLVRTHVPTFVVNAPADERGDVPFKKVLIALDGSVGSRVAALRGIDLAAAADGSVFFARLAKHPADTDALADACAYATARGVAFDHASLSSPPVDAILDSAATCHANLIVIAADGDEHRLFPVTGTLGDLLRTSDVPVLVLPVGASSAVTSVRSSTAAR